MSTPLLSSYRRFNEHNVSRDIRTMNLDTQVKICISDIGIYIPECNTTSPLEAYLRIEDVINIMNRGVDIEIPDIPYNNGITSIIENILLLYDSKNNEYSNKGGKVVDVSTALETIMSINNTKVSNITKEKDRDINDKSTIFDIKDLYTNTAEGLSNEFMSEFAKLTGVKHGVNSDPRELLRKAEHKKVFEEEKNISRETIITMSNLYEKYVSPTNIKDDNSDYDNLELS